MAQQQATSVIGVAVSTFRRPEVLERSQRMWGMAGQPDAMVIIRDEVGQGVAATKNRGLAALMDAGCDHLFLADDDMWPVVSEWWLPYVNNSQPHLMHCWGKSRYLGLDKSRGVTMWSWPRGVLLYVTRDVVHRVGGMRTEFRNAGEHAEWSRRIHNCGCTAYAFQDAALARSGVWHCLDYAREVPSTLSADRYGPVESLRRKALYEKYRGSTDFVEYRTAGG